MKSNSAKGTAGPRDLALKILTRVNQTSGYADRVLETVLFRFPLSEQDRSLTTELVYGSLRWQGRLDWILSRLYHGKVESIPDSIQQILRLGLYQLHFLDRVPSHAAVNESVRMAKLSANPKWGNVVNGMLRTYLRDRKSFHHTLSETDSAEEIAGWMSHPVWLIERWLRDLGFERTVRLCEANNQRPPIGIRINSLKTDLESVTAQLGDQGIDFQVSDSVPDWLTVQKLSPYIRQLLDQGLISIQDGSASLVARLVDPKSNELILDVAAAPGGKSSHMAELSGDQAHIFALDRHVSRMRKLREGVQRLGIQHVFPLTADSRALPIQQADKILLDVPCSGMGVIRRRVELRWRMKPTEIPKLVSLQRALLEEAGSVLNPGGVLVYSTCTVCQEENHDMMEWFLSEYQEFKIEPANSLVSDTVVSELGFIETWPDDHGLDGSFAVRMRKMR
ncbi:16S rRNA (cytosine(967)-C(5))-methyltransferase RsmB [candidate division KSB1 bacterium]|nr:16S rRNA (cytosine(967)-C(5))-methyltransferase RsmB [candidate division KSB1 bacterium]